MGLVHPRAAVLLPLPVAPTRRLRSARAAPTPAEADAAPRATPGRSPDRLYPAPLLAPSLSRGSALTFPTLARTPPSSPLPPTSARHCCKLRVRAVPAAPLLPAPPDRHCIRLPLPSAECPPPSPPRRAHGTRRLEPPPTPPTRASHGPHLPPSSPHGLAPRPRLQPPSPRAHPTATIAVGLSPWTATSLIKFVPASRGCLGQSLTTRQTNLD